MRLAPARAAVPVLAPRPAAACALDPAKACLHRTAGCSPLRCPTPACAAHQALCRHGANTPACAAHQALCRHGANTPACAAHQTLCVYGAQHQPARRTKLCVFTVPNASLRGAPTSVCLRCPTPACAAHQTLCVYGAQHQPVRRTKLCVCTVHKHEPADASSSAFTPCPNARLRGVLKHAARCKRSNLCVCTVPKRAVPMHLTLRLCRAPYQFAMPSCVPVRDAFLRTSSRSLLAYQFAKPSPAPVREAFLRTSSRSLLAYQFAKPSCVPVRDHSWPVCEKMFPK